MTQIANDELKTAHTELPIPSDLYYGNFHGIIPSYLSTSHAHLRKHARSLVFFAGDSSLDNKYWVLDKNKPVIEPFDTLLSPTVMKPDLAYHLTQLLWASEKMAVMNCSVEATTIADRNKDLLSQDMIIRDNITSDDILIVSIGGNDIALRPSIMTALNLAVLVYLNSFKALDERPETCWGVSHFIRLFKDNIQAYVERLVAKTKPRLCLICTIYFTPTRPILTVGRIELLMLLTTPKAPQECRRRLELCIVWRFRRLRLRGEGGASTVVFGFDWETVDGLCGTRGAL
ncbi:hypothetical protein BC829DRAFT_391628 [Chytridium lagenaria]|nr:hypothetical protein BC829DRAFT_391628 [Chytridium lagenaria]